LVSQLFFDNEAFFAFCEKVRQAGINVPIEAGIMPVTNKKQIERMVSLCGASLPPKFRRILDRYEDRPAALFDAGLAYAINQIVDLIASGADGIHIYTMNKPEVARRICAGIKNLI
jgi:methylenetetrahydrofolate reductase (NADPH)